MDMNQTLTHRIKNKAIELGFTKVGVARAEKLDLEGGKLHDWLVKGFHASMDWLSRNTEKRIDPAKILPNAKSVLSVALNYYTAAQHTSAQSTGKISRYAWGDDYHIVMTERLAKLLRFIESENPLVEGKFYVDTGPVMEKAWAVRAGIGWMGKHTNIISREFGSWLFLGEILLDIELEYDEPMADLCGSCTACIDACPTRAIVHPYILDSNKCISYLTIEHRGELPNEFTKKFENWVYGCDICQDVCPWNRFQKETTEAAFQPREETIEPQLSDLVKMNQEEFSSRFRHSPIKRTKHAGLVRNAQAVLESQNSSE
jgi:epoxyqueuosine reductase